MRKSFQEKVKNSDVGTNGLKGKKERKYQWDYRRNDIEVYDKDNHHLGSMDPTTSEMYKPAVKARMLPK